ncbi:MAG TPA: hypothetical protein VF375_03765 [Candidatus Limnocylindrales bacterium]
MRLAPTGLRLLRGLAPTLLGRRLRCVAHRGLLAPSRLRLRCRISYGLRCDICRDLRLRLWCSFGHGLLRGLVPSRLLLGLRRLIPTGLRRLIPGGLLRRLLLAPTRLGRGLRRLVPSRLLGLRRLVPTGLRLLRRLIPGRLLRGLLGLDPTRLGRWLRRLIPGRLLRGLLGLTRRLIRRWSRRPWRPNRRLIGLLLIVGHGLLPL